MTKKNARVVVAGDNKSVTVDQVPGSDSPSPPAVDGTQSAQSDMASARNRELLAEIPESVWLFLVDSVRSELRRGADSEAKARNQERKGDQKAS